MNLNMTVVRWRSAAHRGWRSLLAFAAVCSVAPSAIWAANMNFDDTSPNEIITLTVVDFEGGFFAGAPALQQIQPPGLGVPGSITVPEDVPLNFSGRWIDNGLAQPGGRIIYLVESPFVPTLPPPLISDILRYSIGRDDATGLATINGTFLSDVNDDLGTVPVGTDPGSVFLETGTTVPFFEPFLTGQINSDVNVPEPGTLGLLATGLVGLAYVHWRRKRI